MPRSALKPGRVYIPSSDLRMHAAPKQEAANRELHPRARAALPLHRSAVAPLPSGASHRLSSMEAAGKAPLEPLHPGRDSGSTATPQAIRNAPLGTHVLQRCSGKIHQHGSPKHPGQPRLRDGIFCVTPSESCSEELGGTAGLLHPRGGTAKSISQNPSALKHPQNPWSQLRAGPGCSKVPPQRVQGKGFAGSVGAGTTWGPRRDHVGTTQGAMSIMQRIAQICQAPAAAAEGWRRRGRGWRGGKPKCR